MGHLMPPLFLVLTGPDFLVIGLDFFLGVEIKNKSQTNAIETLLKSQAAV